MSNFAPFLFIFSPSLPVAARRSAVVKNDLARRRGLKRSRGGPGGGPGGDNENEDENEDADPEAEEEVSEDDNLVFNDGNVEDGGDGGSDDDDGEAVF